MSAPTLHDTESFSVKACACCGTVQLAIGPAVFKLSKAGFSSLASLLGEVKGELDRFSEGTLAPGSAEELIASHLADRKFIA